MLCAALGYRVQSLEPEWVGEAEERGEKSLKKNKMIDKMFRSKSTEHSVHCAIAITLYIMQFGNL